MGTKEQPGEGSGKINIVITMAGRGSRFTDAGYALPKPMIPAKGRPMFSWALSSLDFYDSNVDRIIFICLKEHVDKFGIDEELRKEYPSCEVIALDHVTEGQACTVLLAKKSINNGTPLCIYNIDTVFRSGLKRMIRDPKKRFDGIITVFEATNPDYSYAKIGDDGFIAQVAEKKPISGDATIGLYFFSKGSDFVNAAEAMIAKDLRVNNEFYVGPCYNELIAKGKRIVPDHARQFHVLGDPESLKKFEKGILGIG